MKSLLILLCPGVLLAGSFPDDDEIADSQPTIWADAATVIRGPVDITVPQGAATTYGLPSDATGPSDAGDDVQLGVVSLGDGGSATLRFDTPVADGVGADLAIFENGFSLAFLELAHVEVSSDGFHFVRFPSVSETQTSTQIGAFTFNAIDPSELHNLAGKYEAGFGTPFDLAELRGTSPHLDVSHITHVRVIDVVGSIDPGLGTRDSLGSLINDPFKTNFDTGGFDLDAVGALHSSPTTIQAWTDLHFPGGGMTGDDDDPDQDRLPNLVEYATGGDPNTFTAGPLRVGTGSSTQLSWRRSIGRAGATLQLQGSPDLSGWFTLCESVGSADTIASSTGVTVDESADTSLVTATVPANYRYFRLKAIR